MTYWPLGAPRTVVAKSARCNCRATGLPSVARGVPTSAIQSSRLRPSFITAATDEQTVSQRKLVHGRVDFGLGERDFDRVVRVGVADRVHLDVNAVYPSRREEAAASVFGDPQNVSVSRQLSAAAFRHANLTVRVDELEVSGCPTERWRCRDGRPVSVGP